MSALFPNGTVFSVSTALGAAIAVSAISNANPAVATATSPPTDGSIGVMMSGWSGLTERVVRTANAAASTFELAGIDTTNVTRFPAGQGAGSIKLATDFVDLSQVTNSEKTGGEQQFYQWQYLEDRSGRQRQRPTFKNAKVLTVTLDYDPALAWYNALVEADALRDPVVLRATLPNGVQLYYYVYPSFDGDPSLVMNTNMQNVATFSMISDFTRYEAAA